MKNHMSDMSPEEVRQLIRKGQMTGPTAGMAASYAQANLVVLQKDLAFDFLLFCQRNQKPCPVLDVTDAGSPVPAIAAPGADIRTFRNTGFIGMACLLKRQRILRRIGRMIMSGF